MSYKNEVFNFKELYNKEFYIVDCSNFIFYPKIVRTIGFEISTDELNIITDAIEHLTKENRRYSIEYLEQYKTFEEAEKEAKRLNNLPENKKRANEWNSPEAIFKRKILEESLKGEW